MESKSVFLTRSPCFSRSFDLGRMALCYGDAYPEPDSWPAAVSGAPAACSAAPTFALCWSWNSVRYEVPLQVPLGHYKHCVVLASHRIGA